MPDNSVSYFCRVNDKPSSIFVNTTLAGDAPNLSKPWLLWVWVNMKAPRPDGLSSSEEAPLLFQLEDKLKECICSRCEAIYPGRITGENRREFYFYATNPDDFDRALSEAMASFSGYEVWTGKKKDPEWEQYLDVLYPTEEQFESVKNSSVLAALDEHGDSHNVPREIRHWAYFRSESDRSLFKAEVVKLGFAVDWESHQPGEELPFGITLSKKQPATQQALDASSRELLNLAERFNGDYDGWETEVITQ